MVAQPALVEGCRFVAEGAIPVYVGVHRARPKLVMRIIGNGLIRQWFSLP
jgi:hypothetical protein